MDDFGQRDYDDAVDLVKQRQKRLRDRSAKQIVAQIMTRRGVAGMEQAREVDQAWQDIVPDLCRQTRVGAIRRGVLEVYVSGSAVLQHLTFEKNKLLKKLGEKLPQATISDIRFRVGLIED